MTGSLADYDRLCEALEAYEDSPNAGSHAVLRQAALRCGCGPYDPVIRFATRRRETYRATITGAVAYLQEKIDGLIEGAVG